MAALLAKSTPRARGARGLYRRSQSSFASQTPAHSGKPWALSCPTESNAAMNVWPTGHDIWPGGHGMGCPGDAYCCTVGSLTLQALEPGGWK